MKFNKWTRALAAAGVISMGSAAQAEEAANQVLTALSSTTLSGYVDTSANWRVGNDTGAIPGRSFDGADKQDGFNLNVVGVTLEKPMDEGQWSAGYRVDLLFGPDANYYGTTLNGGAAAAPDDFNIKQAYAAFRAPVGNGLDIKAGVFDTIIGYEVFESGNNPNYSRSYGYFIEPTHHTGVLASYHVNDMISIAGGIANTWNAPINGRAGGFAGGNPSESLKTFMGAATVTLPESAGALAGTVLYGGVVDGRAFANNNEDSTSYYGGFTLPLPVTGLALGGAFDYVENWNGTDFWAWAGAGYVSYQWTEKLRLNLRGDYTRGEGGFYYAAAPGDDNELVSATATLDYSLWNGLITRLEGRWDHSLEGDAFADSPGSASADDNVFTVALNLIYKF